MKGYLIIPFLAFYLLSVSGVSVPACFCEGRLTSMDMDCAACAGKVKKSCCPNVALPCHIRDTQQASRTGFFSLPAQHRKPPAFTGLSFLPDQASSFARVLYLPPLLASVPLYLRHQVWVI